MGEGQETFLNPFVRRAAHLYWRVSRGMTLGVRGVVADPNRGVFLVRHTYVPGWHLPGGGVEAGESAVDALARELLEEGCIAMAGAPVLHGVFLNAALYGRDHVLVYRVPEYRIVEAKRRDREIAEAGFFRLDALPDEVTPGTRARLDEIASGAAPAPLW